MIYGVLVDQPASPLLGQGEVVEAGDAEHGVVNAVTFQAAVAQDLPALHPGEVLLDASPATCPFLHERMGYLSVICGVWHRTCKRAWAVIGFAAMALLEMRASQGGDP
jgi:hypothetical protein